MGLTGALTGWVQRAASARGGSPERAPRVRVPPPLIRYRLPSGRGATEQPNVTSELDARLDLRFWLALVATGVATGMFGALLMLLLFSVEHVVWGDRRPSTLGNVELASAPHRVVVLLVSGAIAGVAWYLLRRFTPGERAEVDDVLWSGTGRLSWRRGLGTSVISEVVIAMGASIGREQAPKLMGGISGTVIGQWTGLTAGQRRLLVACGAGAGLAAVYNVPYGGALFTAEVLWGSLSLPVVLPALACSLIATVTTWWYLPNHATYIGLPHFHLSAALGIWALLAGPVLGLCCTGYLRLIGWVSHHRAGGRLSIVTPIVVFGLLGLIGIVYPQLFGNGKDLAEVAFLGRLSLLTLLALGVLKPIVTVACLGSGASGGLFTPTLSTGAALGGMLGAAWSLAFPGTGVGAYAVVGAAAMLAAGLQAPLAAVALMLELTGTGFSILVPVLLAATTATLVAHRLDGYSIYSARLPAARPGDRDVADELTPSATEPSAGGGS